MKILVKVKPGAKFDEVKEISSGSFEIRTKAQPIEGKANQAVIDLLSGHLGIAKSRIRVSMGHTSKQKVIEII